MSSSDKRNSGKEVPYSWKARQHLRLKTDHCYDTLTEEGVTIDNNYLGLLFLTANTLFRVNLTQHNL